LAVVARAAAEAGAAAEFDRASERAWDLLGRHTAREAGGGRGRAFLELARAAAVAERWPLAEHAGQRALEVALARGDDQEADEAERFLRDLWEQTGGMRWIGRPHGPQRPD
ncbi:MAG TPA: hypothetical protein VGR37_24115, partial [Longimicrobiaceae bacterium]|nr:hypothetical protein [Longimicrobiaceae bacterium]